LPAQIPRICRDANNDLVLACANSALANAIASGDKDLLALKIYDGISILRGSGTGFSSRLQKAALIHFKLIVTLIF
jgi:predicted nucleic acid-binding protein